MIGGKENDDMFSRAALSLKGWQQENVELQDEIDRLTQENLRLGKLATQRGARMQIMWDWMGVSTPCDDYLTIRDQFLWAHAVEKFSAWFDDDGVPVDA